MPTPKAEKDKKATKPRKSPAKKVVVMPEAVVSRPTHDQIAVLAHQFWVERGHTHGHHMQDWLRAEEELLKAAS